MFRTFTLGLSALSIMAMPVATSAKKYDDDRKEYRDDRKDDAREFREDRRDYRRKIRDERKDYRDERKDFRKGGGDWRSYRNYDYNRPAPGQTAYYADQYYRDGSYYQPRRMAADDRIYRGRDNRYYCRRTDGTTGLIVGGLGGGVLGNLIAPGGSKGLGTVLGGLGGALLGRGIDRNNVTCR